MHRTFLQALQLLRASGVLTLDHSVLVSCGGSGDRDALQAAGLESATITNLDRNHAGDVEPYRWQRCDAEDLPFADDSFDWGMVHAGLHHCRSPHRGLLELLRVSRCGVLVIEARDSLLMRLAVRCGLTPEYEIEPVALSGSGGLRGGAVPNFIYRWTEREVRKTVESATPGTVSELRFFYGLRLPETRMTMAPAWKRFAYALAASAAQMAFRLTPKAGNELGFAVIKTGQRKPWMSANLVALNSAYHLPFDPAKHRSVA